MRIKAEDAEKEVLISKFSVNQHVWKKRKRETKHKTRRRT